MEDEHVPSPPAESTFPISKMSWSRSRVHNAVHRITWEACKSAPNLAPLLRHYLIGWGEEGQVSYFFLSIRSLRTLPLKFYQLCQRTFLPFQVKRGKSHFSASSDLRSAASFRKHLQFISFFLFKLGSYLGISSFSLEKHRIILENNFKFLF